MSKRRSEKNSEPQDELTQIEESISSQSSVLSRMQQEMEELPSQIRQIQQRLDRLSASMGGVPKELQEKGAILAEVDVIRPPEVPKEKKPDWGLEADIRVGRTLRVVVYASFALESVMDASPEPITDSNSRLRRILERDWMAQTSDEEPQQSKRIKIEVHNVQVQKCRFRGAPKDAERTLILSPEAGVPIVLEGDYLSFDFAPVLAIKNDWPGSEIPTFQPMRDEIRVPLEDFEKREPISLRLSLKEQNQRMNVRLQLEPLKEN